jgi:hypothetical protein
MANGSPRLFMQLGLMAWCFSGCLSHKRQEALSDVSGNLPSRMIQTFAPPLANDLLIRCHSRVPNHPAFDEAKATVLELYRQGDGTYTAYLTVDGRLSGSSSQIKVYKNLVNHSHNNIDIDSAFYGKAYTRFSNGGLNMFAVDVYYQDDALLPYTPTIGLATLFDFSYTINPYKPKILTCASVAKPARDVVSNGGKFSIVTDEEDPKTKESKKVLRELEIDWVTFKNGQEVLYSTTKYSKGVSGEALRHTPVYGDGDQFIGYVADYFSDLPISLTILSANDLQCLKVLRSQNIHFKSHRRCKIVSQGISLRFKQVICEYLAKGLPPPESSRYSLGWSMEWQMFVKEAQKQGCKQLVLNVQ